MRKLNKSLAAEANIDIEVNFGARIGDWARSVALWGTLCLAILGFIYMLGCYAIGNFRTVYILNGTHQSTAVSIDGNKDITLKPLSHMPVYIREQPLTLSCPDKSLPIPARTIKVPKDFWTNGDNRNRLHIINPDRLQKLDPFVKILLNISKPINALPNIHPRPAQVPPPPHPA